MCGNFPVPSVTAVLLTWESTCLHRFLYLSSAWLAIFRSPVCLGLWVVNVGEHLLSQFSGFVGVERASSLARTTLAAEGTTSFQVLRCWVYTATAWGRMRGKHAISR
eukprot:2744563-Amphidinium_carterae.1